MARACSVCESGDPLVHASDSAGHANRLRLALDFQYLTATAASDDMPGATESVDQLTLQPVVVYSPLAELNLILQAPLLRKDWKLTGGGASEHVTPLGLGDIDLGARWFVWQSDNWTALSRQGIGLTGGVYLPTGANDARADGERIDDHAQLGRGSFGPYLGATYAYHRDPWNTFVSATVTTHTTNSFDYHYGTGVQWAVREDYRMRDWLAFELGADGRYARQDNVGDEVQVNTGGLVLAVAPGAAVNVANNLWVRAHAEIPVYTRLDGMQTLGVTVATSLEMLVQ
ncbi:MAG TPA: hypothetical protein VFP84_40840 [Kofleriaceae bacterium]|nr:hypothetical protein [Kofleriaceae bacterium]